MQEIESIISIAGDGLIPGPGNNYEKKLHWRSSTSDDDDDDDNRLEFLTIDIWGRWSPQVVEMQLTYQIALDTLRGLWDLIVRRRREALVASQTQVWNRGGIVAKQNAIPLATLPGKTWLEIKCHCSE
ncbi:MAG: hypothetical protein Q9168_008114 [Polycauliona sp. 1 TL-2023]